MVRRTGVTPVTKALLSPVLAILLLLLGLSPSQAGEVRVIKLGYILAPHSQLGAGADVFAAEVSGE
jgi:hypothetical protein